MTIGLWFLGIIAFFIYDHLVGLGLEDNDDYKYFALALFWFISVPVLFIKWMKNYRPTRARKN